MFLELLLLVEVQKPSTFNFEPPEISCPTGPIFNATNTTLFHQTFTPMFTWPCDSYIEIDDDIARYINREAVG